VRSSIAFSAGLLAWHDGLAIVSGHWRSASTKIARLVPTAIYSRLNQKYISCRLYTYSLTSRRGGHELKLSAADCHPQGVSEQTSLREGGDHDIAIGYADYERSSQRTVSDAAHVTDCCEYDNGKFFICHIP
jgi:hypothetical protein